jgi:hypothetical protein
MSIPRLFAFVNGLDDPNVVYTNHSTIVNEADANVVTSMVCLDIHAPALDIDMEARLIPSSTPGHYHLYIDKPMTWRKYKKLLKVMAKVGILQQGYVNSAIRNGYTALRKEGTYKPGSLQGLINSTKILKRSVADSIDPF